MKTLVVGGTGPTGPPIVAGLEQRGHDVTICHTGGHEIDEVMHLPHIHCDVRDRDAFADAVGDQEWDVAIVTYGRLRMISEVLAGRVGHFVSVGGGPAVRGYFDPWAHTPPGLPLPTPETAPTASEEEDGKSYRVARTEAYVFEHHPTATHFRYPYVYGPRQLAPREWLIVKRILDKRPHIIVADGGQSAHSFGYADNLAHAIHLAVDQPEAAAGRIFHTGDEEVLTLRQVIEICAAELGHEWDIVSMPPELAVPARPLMMQPSTHHRVLDTSSLRYVLGYRDAVPARQAIARTARWLAENPHPPGDMVERILEDPFDYDNEDRLVEWWRSATATAPDLEWSGPPGYGLSYAGPGTSYQRADTRI
jgi:nucleoside-diphosphate-sugar epimerase